MNSDIDTEAARGVGPRLRILISAYACQPAHGSEFGLAWNTILALSDYHDVTVITRLKNRTYIEALHEYPSSLSFSYYERPVLARLKRGPIGARCYYYFWQKGLRRHASNLAKNGRFDIAHHLTWTGIGQPVGIRDVGIPLVLGPVGGGVAPPVRTMFLSRRPREYLYEILRRFNQETLAIRPSVRSTLKSADEVLAQNVETSMIIGRLRSTPVRVMSYVRCDKEIAELYGSHLRPATGNGGKRELLYVGRLVEWKGLKLCLKALANLPRDQFHLTVIGDGPARRHFERTAAKLGVIEQVDFAGWRPHGEVLEAMLRSDLLLFPSCHDEGGFVVLEALTMGLRPLVLDLGGPQAFAPSGAVVIPVEPAYSLAQRFKDAILHCLDYQRGTFCRVGPDHTWDAFARELTGIYESVLAVRRCS